MMVASMFMFDPCLAQPAWHRRSSTHPSYLAPC